MSLDLSSMSDDDLKALYSNTQAIHQNESSGASDSARIVNPASGAEGSMQVMPATQKDPGFGVRPSDGSPEDTARAGRDYYAALHMKYKDPITAAVAYNWGPGHADKWLANGAKLEDLPDETLKYVSQMHQQQGQQGNPAARQETQPEASGAQSVSPSAPQVATGSVTKQGAKPAPQVTQQPAKAPGTPEAPADTGGALTRGLRGVAQGLGAGWYDELMGGMNYLEGRAKGTDKGRSWDDYIKVERDKLANGGTAGTVGNVAGTVGSVLIPGAAVTKAPLVVGKLGRLGLGVAQGAAQGAVLGAGEADDGDRLAGAGKGAALGGALGTIAPILTGPSMAQKVQRFVNKAGGEEQARRVAEASTALKALADREAQGGVALGARDANAVANRGVQEALDVVKDPAQRTALLRGRGLNDADLSNLPPEIAETLRFQNAVQAATAAKPASNNLISRAGRVAADNLIPIKPVRDYVVNHVLGGRATREQTIAGLVGESKVADAVTAKLGASKASQALDTLKATAKAQADKDAAAAAQKIADAAAKAQQQAQVRIAMAKATRMPQGGGFQTLLAGGDSGLNLPSKQAIQDLRALSQHPVLGKLADELRRTGAIKDNEAGFYGLTNALRKLQEGRQAAWRAKNPKGNP